MTGHSGFVGINLIDFLASSNKLINHQKGSKVEISQDVVIHLAGKAHDLKKTSNPEEYYRVNTELTQKVFDAFLASEAKVFITLSSVKAVAIGQRCRRASTNVTSAFECAFGIE